MKFSKIIGVVSSVLLLGAVEASYAGPTAVLVPSVEDSINQRQPHSKNTMAYVGFMSGRATQNMNVYSQYDSFFRGEVASLHPSTPITFSQHTGFSGAGYADIESYKSEFKQSILAQIQSTPKGGVAIIAMGGSVDGLGIGYELVHEVKSALVSPGAVEVRVSGLVSDAVVPYHLEGAEKGWGDVISSRQDSLLLMETKDGSWELLDQTKRAMNQSRTADFSLDVAKLPNTLSAKHYVWGGADQALREGVELLVRSVNELPESRKGILSMELQVAYEPIPPDKKGYRAAPQLALIVAENPSLQSKVTVNVTGFSSGGESQTAEKAVYETQKGQELRDVVHAEEVKTVEGSGEVEQAKNRYYASMKETYKLALETVERVSQGQKVQFLYNVSESNRYDYWPERAESHDRLAERNKLTGKYIDGLKGSFKNLLRSGSSKNLLKRSVDAKDKATSQRNGELGKGKKSQAERARAAVKKVKK